MGRKPYTPERAYRLSVRPLAIFFMAGGALVAIGSCVLPITWVPFVRDEWLKRLVMLASCLVSIAIGVGLYRRSKMAWYAMFAWITLGTLWTVAGSILDPWIGDARWPVAAYGVIVNGAFGVGSYFATRPVFIRKENAVFHEGAGEEGSASPPEASA